MSDEPETNDWAAKTADELLQCCGKNCTVDADAVAAALREAHGAGETKQVMLEAIRASDARAQAHPAPRNQAVAREIAKVFTIGTSFIPALQAILDRHYPERGDERAALEAEIEAACVEQCLTCDPSWRGDQYVAAERDPNGGWRHRHAQYNQECAAASIRERRYQRQQQEHK